MIFEPSIMPGHAGWIEVICGGMFSGKTEELIRRAKRARIAGQSVMIIKPSVDNRFDSENIVSHNQNILSGVKVDTADQILLLTGDKDVICIDEAQFFDNRLVEVANTLADNGKRVIVAGLDMDYTGRPFEPVPNLMAVAEYVTKLHAICSESGILANYSQRIVDSKKRLLIGKADSYEPRSRACFRPPVDERKSEAPQLKEKSGDKVSDSRHE